MTNRGKGLVLWPELGLGRVQVRADDKKALGMHPGKKEIAHYNLLPPNILLYMWRIQRRIIFQS